MSEHWRSILEHLPDHLPFVVSATRFGDEGRETQLDMRSLLTAIVISVLTALGSSWATTRELSVKFEFIARQIAETSAKVEQHNAVANADRQALAERMARIETMTSMNPGMNGGRR